MAESNDRAVIQETAGNEEKHDAMAEAARAAYQAPQKEIFCEPKDFSEGWKYILGPVAASCAVQMVIDYLKQPAKK